MQSGQPRHPTENGIVHLREGRSGAHVSVNYIWRCTTDCCLILHSRSLDVVDPHFRAMCGEDAPAEGYAFDIVLSDGKNKGYRPWHLEHFFSIIHQDKFVLAPALNHLVMRGVLAVGSLITVRHCLSRVISLFLCLSTICSCPSFVSFSVCVFSLIVFVCVCVWRVCR